MDKKELDRHKKLLNRLIKENPGMAAEDVADLAFDILKHGKRADQTS